jgi:hypothetical protein
MEVILKTKNPEIRSKAANQNASQQLLNLELKLTNIKIQIENFKNEPIRKPSNKHKLLKKELSFVKNEIRTIKKAIIKCEAVKSAASYLGIKHGNVILNKTKYYW